MSSNTVESPTVPKISRRLKLVISRRDNNVRVIAKMPMLIMRILRVFFERLFFCLKVYFFAIEEMVIHMPRKYKKGVRYEGKTALIVAGLYHAKARNEEVTIRMSSIKKMLPFLFRVCLLNVVRINA
jgi:hypothetical protein